MSHDSSSSRQLAAILFTDIIGYTAVMQADEHQAVRIIHHYTSTLEKWVTHYQGQIVNDFGDGSLCIFTSSTHAMLCAIDIQKELRTDPVVPLRIGLHIGEIFFKDGKALGDSVNIASRIQSLGQENAILISAEFHDKIKNNPSITAQSLGFFDFKNVQNPMEVFALSSGGLIVPDRKRLGGKLGPKKKPWRWPVYGLLLLFGLLGAYQLFTPLPLGVSDPQMEKSIAVLPFTDMSQGKDQEFFSDGLTEDIITQLAKIKAFTVTSRTSVMQYKNNLKSIRQIGRELGAANILAGSVQRSGNQVRITAMLTNASTDKNLWSAMYDRTLDDIFSIQTDISQQIANALQAELSAEEKLSMAKKYTDNTEAYQLYLQGRYQWNKRLEDPVRKSIDYFIQAIAIDSAYALAYAGLGDAYLMLGVYNVLRPDESFPLAKLYTEKALELDPELGEAYATLIDISIHYNWDPVAGEQYFQKAVHLNPKYANTYHWHSEVFIMQNNFDQAIVESKKALDLEPYLLIVNTQLAVNYIYAGRFDDALNQLKKTIDFDSTFAFGYYNMGIAYLGKEDYGQAVNYLRKASNLVPKKMNILSVLGYAKGRHGEKEGALQIEQNIQQQAKLEYVSHFDQAIISLGVGNESMAIQYLESAYSDREPWMPFIDVNPIFKSIHNDPRFKALVRKIKSRR